MKMPSALRSLFYVFGVLKSIADGPIVFSFKLFKQLHLMLIAKALDTQGLLYLCQCLFFKGEVGCLGVSGVPESSVSSNLRLP